MRTSVQQVQCALDADDATLALCDGVDQIIHVEPALPLPLEADQWLDMTTRGTYNLLNAAAASQVPRATILGSMEVFMAYPVHHGVMPDWQPRPACTPAALGPHMAEHVAREFAMCSSVRVLLARIGTLVAEPPVDDADAPRWWVTAAEVAETLTGEMLADDARTANGDAGTPFVRWNLARGGLSPLLVGSPFVAANGGTPSWVAPPPPAQPSLKPSPAGGSKPLALLLGGSGMFGPDIIPNIESEYDLRITDVIDRPAIRDEAQVMRWDTGNGTTTAAAPDALDIDGKKQGDHEWRSVDISNYEEVEAATAGTDVTMVLSVVRTHAVLSFDVNCKGVYNACRAAVAHGHSRLINTGPWSVVAGTHCQHLIVHWAVHV